jgi:hypothetical protein
MKTAELPRRVIPAGTELFHGTDSAGPMDRPDGPAWFCFSPAAAEGWAGWAQALPAGRRKGPRRVLAYRVSCEVELLDTVAFSDWQRLGLMLLDDDEPSPWALAAAVAKDGAAGWYGGREVMLSRPDAILVKTGEETLAEGREAAG